MGDVSGVYISLLPALMSTVHLARPYLRVSGRHNIEHKVAGRVIQALLLLLLCACMHLSAGHEINENR